MNQPPKQLPIHRRRTIRIQHPSTTRNQHPTSRRNITIMNMPTRRALPRTNVQIQLHRQHEPAIRITTSRTLKRTHDNSRRSHRACPVVSQRLRYLRAFLLATGCFLVFSYSLSFAVSSSCFISSSVRIDSAVFSSCFLCWYPLNR